MPPTPRALAPPRPANSISLCWSTDWKPSVEQGITIDVAHRYFSTSRRSFIVADAPGHEQYTRNMATAASTADLAVLLVDARKGLLTQTLRHSYIVALMGIRQVVLAVNKMDAVGWDERIFDGHCRIVPQVCRRSWPQ